MQKEPLKVKLYLLCVSCLLFLLACKNEEITPPISFVNVVYPIGGLGDQSYVDNIFKGVVAAKYDQKFILNHFFPDSINGAKVIIDSLLSIDANSKGLLIFADGTYSEYLNTKNFDFTFKNILLLDANSEHDVWSINFSLYGAAYLAGIAAAEVSNNDTIAFIAGMKLPELVNCYNGFLDGFIRNGGKHVNIYYLDDTPSGFEMIKEAEDLTKLLLKKTDLIFGAAGGSNIGIFNVLRGKSNKYAIGIDSDQSHFAPDAVIGSVIKDIKYVLETSIKKMQLGNYVPQKEHFILQSGSVDFWVNPNFVALVDSQIKIYRDEAILKEQINLNKK